MTKPTRFHDTVAFLRRALRAPRQFGAVMPSSRWLAGAMARHLPSNPSLGVLELGPGTGVVTDALVRAGLSPGQLVAIERCPDMAARLRGRFPGAGIIEGDAFAAAEHLRRHRPDLHGRIGTVVSSLPLLNYPTEAAEELTRQLQTWLHPEGRVVQYSYRLTRTGRLGPLQAVQSAVVWLNLPPARVSVYRYVPDYDSVPEVHPLAGLDLEAEPSVGEA